ncbi:3'-5' exonuclease domain-containing protein 2 [Thiorhodococcus mannitoliphagus]|uniref:3'-5' exonuclease domain-containing protein 2 n=1 Tax=Thiorhodococcus mannitoliphagus TaxID=329406 RepID=A0A6P1DZU7_9GAMM|nr:3'-5' exonuclease [Thiorhodococcus mannitoliphagus]NEX22286.1 3'-5' exonuclease domain-containing protein 2 [Thiorhodococcus mannitoliphagus]
MQDLTRRLLDPPPAPQGHMTNSKRLPHPSKEATAQMPVFDGLPLSQIHLIEAPAQIEFAMQSISEAEFIGFDTESKPTFTTDAVRDGPHVVQFATMEQAFIVQIGPATPIDFLKSVIESSRIVKVGFGLNSDRGPLKEKLGLRLGASVDLAQAVRKLGYRQAVGAKAAVAIVLGRRLQKSKKTSTSNWALPMLRPNQLLYAANDAYAALAVFEAMGRPYSAPQLLRPALI